MVQPPSRKVKRGHRPLIDDGTFAILLAGKGLFEGKETPVDKGERDPGLQELIDYYLDGFPQKVGRPMEETDPDDFEGGDDFLGSARCGC